MHNALRLITTGTVITLTIALATEQGIAESTAAGTADSASSADTSTTEASRAASPSRPADGVDTLIEQAEAQLERGETQAAITTLTEAIAAHPSSSLAYTRLGGAYLLNQDYASAIEQFQEAISNDNQNAGAFIGLGMAYLHLKQTGPAKAALTEAKRLNPSKSADIDALLARIEQTASAHHP
jgi:tetratricopeptide (TPR) repeat protein